MTIYLLDQIFWEYCVIPNIFIENILKHIDYFLLKPNILGILRNIENIYLERIDVY